MQVSLGHHLPIELVSIDPGTRKSAIALWDTAQNLVYADDLPNNEVMTLLGGLQDTRVMVEIPVLYPDKRKQHRDVKNLLRVAENFKKRAKRGFGIAPSAWKGQVPKNIHRHRILKALKPVEKQAIVTIDNHNTIDAVGIGLWVLGRLGRGGTRGR